MGYYENPPIVQPSRGGEIISASITNAANSIAQGLIARGERKRQEEKERKLTLQKLQDRKNETDLYYNDKLSDWASKETPVDDKTDKKIYDIIQQKITLAADSRIALLNETDSAKRQEYLKNIRNADSSLGNAASFSKLIAQQSATWRLDTKAVKVGTPGGHVINGKNDKEILDNTAAIEILGGMNSMYKDANVDVAEDENGDGFVLNVSGKHKDGSDFNVLIKSKDYLKADAEAGDGLLIPVEGLDTFHTQAKQDIVDKKGNIYEGYLSPNRETVDLPSKGTSGGVGRDIYQITNGQRLQDKAIKAKINETSKITASGILSADGPSRLRTLLNYTLKQGIGFYDDSFKGKTPEEQQTILSNVLTEKAFTEMTKGLEQTEENGQKVYWNPTADIKLKDKISAAQAAGPKEPKEKPTTYKTEYYDNIIQGYTPNPDEKITPGQQNYRTRADLVDHLNKLSGSNSKYLTREEVFKRYESSPYKDEDGDPTGKTIKEAYESGDVEGDAKTAFNKVISAGDILIKEGKGYKPVKGYDINSATGRVKLALDQTSDAGERKILQEKLKDARLMDWVKKNPRKASETQEQYAARAKKI
jgi:hypothetical protein